MKVKANLNSCNETLSN